MAVFSRLADFDSRGSASAAQFVNVLQRMEEVGEAAVRGYGAGRGVTIRSCFKTTRQFNAAAWPDGDRMQVGLGAAVLPLLNVLFGAILSDRRVLAGLSGAAADAAPVPAFVYDPAEFGKPLAVELHLDGEKALAAGVLADLCISYVYLHEMGHILCGHCEAGEHLFGSGEVLEFGEGSEGAGLGGEWLEMRQYWEYEADSFTLPLLLQYIHMAARHRRHGKWLAKLAGSEDERRVRMHTAALTSAAISALFLYMAGCRLRYEAPNTHPDPVVRSLYMKDMLAALCAREWGCREEEMLKLQFEYLQPFALSLARMGLGSVEDWDQEEITRMSEEVGRLVGRRKYRELTREWSWLPESEWMDA